MTITDPTWRIRPPTEEDLPAVGVLFRDRDVARYGAPELTDDEIAHDWRRPGFDLAADAFVAEDRSGRIVGYADLLPVSHDQVDGEVVTAPVPGAAALEGLLLDRVEERAARRAAAGAAMHVHLVVPTVEPAREAALQDRGYTFVRTFLRMRLAPETPAPQARWPPGVEARPFRPDVDDEAVFEVVHEAFRGHFGLDPDETLERWRHEALGYPGFDPALWVVAWDDDRVVGALCGYPEDEGGWVRRLAVRQDERGRGIGLALLAEAIRRFRERGLAAVELGVDAENASGATRLYERAGMQVTRHFRFYGKTMGPAAAG